ncbi:MAG: hypothetical protein ACR2FL_01025, partial [Nocardioidaceae bacterium]
RRLGAGAWASRPDRAGCPGTRGMTQFDFAFVPSYRLLGIIPAVTARRLGLVEACLDHVEDRA